METVTWIGTIASVLGLTAAVWAGLKARSASHAAEEAVRQIRQIQAPLRLQDIEAQVVLVWNALLQREWASAQAVAGATAIRSAELREYLAAELSPQEAESLSEAAASLSMVHEMAVRFLLSEAVTPDEIDMIVANDQCMSARKRVSQIRGALMCRGERPSGGGAGHE